jgi:hypothetical protein
MESIVGGRNEAAYPSLVELRRVLTNEQLVGYARTSVTKATGLTGRNERGWVTIVISQLGGIGHDLQVAVGKDG